MNIQKTQKLSSLLALLLLGVFAVCILSVLLTGARSYERLAGRSAATFERRTAAQYLATKVRQADGADRVFAGAFDASDADADTDEGDTLFLEESIGGAAYYTRIYCHDGYIRELLTAADADMTPEDGEKILQADGLRFTAADGRITAEITGTNGETTQVVLTLRSGEGAAA